MSETPPRGLRAAFTPLPPEPRTTRRTLTVAGLWVVTAVPFAVDVDHQGWPAIVIGLLVTGYIAVAAWRLPMVALPVAAVTALFDWRYLFTLALAAQVAGRRTAGPRYALAVVAVAATLGTGAAFAIGQDLYDWSFRVGGLVVFGLFPWLVGLHRRQRAALVRAGWQRAAQLEEQQRIVAEQARLRERARIASDMHDFLGHHLSLAALHAGALELDTTLSERQVAKAGELRASIATAARQLREIIDVLRDAGDPVPTAPAGEGIRELVARSVAAGMDVELDVAVDLDGVDLMRRRAAYRLVQEALTNVAKHAPGAPARVAIGARPDALEISVVNRPPTRPPAGDRARGNTGLAGLRERARLLGGTFDSGPRPDGGFAVCMLLPHAPKPATA
ncbi:sensor histidine kinase, partial [Saccharothrix sp. MB29]|nr:sensor histidine kinase [Saccharothrix sp. MB29]